MHIVGTNKKYILKDVLHAKLKRKEMTLKKEENGIAVQKWNDIQVI